MEELFFVYLIMTKKPKLDKQLLFVVYFTQHLFVLLRKNEMRDVI